MEGRRGRRIGRYAVRRFEGCGEPVRFDPRLLFRELLDVPNSSTSARDAFDPDVRVPLRAPLVDAHGFSSPFCLVFKNATRSVTVNTQARPTFAPGSSPEVAYSATVSGLH